MNKIQNNFCLKLSTCALHESQRIVNWLPFMKTVEVNMPFQHSWNCIVWVTDLSDWHLYNQSRSYLQNKGDDDFLSGFLTVRSLSWTWSIQAIIFLLTKILDSLIERHGHGANMQSLDIWLNLAHMHAIYSLPKVYNPLFQLWKFIRHLYFHC